MTDSNSIEIMQRWKDGDDSAAQELFDRYANRLVALARTRLSQRMKRRVEPEDIVQSVYRSFFCKAGENFTLEQSGDLWRLLAAITINKVRGQVEFHRAQKRGIFLEESIGGAQQSFFLQPEVIADDPTPDDAAAIVEELQSVMTNLQEYQQQIMELVLQNNSVEEIGEKVRKSHRTIRRTIQQVREELETRLARSIG